VKGLVAGSALAVALLLTGSVQGGRLAATTRTAGAGYQVTNLASLGGTTSAGSSINNRGWVAGSSNLAGDQAQHAALWTGGSVIDLGTLGGPNSGVLWPVKNDRGIISGISQTSQPDPLGERWSCSAFFPTATATGHQCLGFVWQDGAMRPLPTLGGTNGFATGANNRGEIVGWAENTVHDSTCVPPQVLQFRAVVWGPRPGQIRELPPLPGDTVSAATALNNRGQVIGISGICDRAVGRFSAIHAVLWEDGNPTDLGTLGGVAWNTPMSINQRGDVVGFANASAAAGGSFAVHAFLRTRKGGIHDLGTLPGDATSQALGINDRREIVGTSCDADFNCRAVIWRNGEITDLNTLIAKGYSGHLITANDINESGRITGQAFDSGSLMAFVSGRNQIGGDSYPPTTSARSSANVIAVSSS
jgi:probable HAF family extracellular repeat protein